MYWLNMTTKPDSLYDSLFLSLSVTLAESISLYSARLADMIGVFRSTQATFAETAN